MTLKVKQSSAYRGEDRWNWSVWLDGDSSDLDAIDHVVYTLHPTFPVPIRHITNRRTGFKLDSSGWGEFEIHLDVVLKSGQIRKRRHWLKLAARPKGSTAATPEASAAEPVAYVSSGAADAVIARKLREELTKSGFRVNSLEDSPVGLPEEKVIDQMLGSAEVAVFLLSGRPSLWTHTEIQRALVHKVPHLVPVLIGSSAELPAALQQMGALRIDSADELSSLAQRILTTAKPPR